MTDSATITMSLEEAIRARHGVCIATIKHDYNVCHSIYTYSKVTICPDVPIHHNQHWRCSYQRYSQLCGCRRLARQSH